MNIQKVPISQVQLWDKNPRNIKTRDFERLKRQIQELGVYKPMIAYPENGGFTVIGGNMRLQALKALGIKEVEISIINPKNEAEKIKIALSDNDRAGEYEEQKLAELVYPFIEDIKLEDYKVDLGEAVDLQSVVENFGPNLDGTEDEVLEIDDSPAITQMGDLFTLGRHRLLCGDATKKEDVERLMDGKRADMVFTDPPYGIDVVGGNLKIGGGGDLRFGQVQKGGRSKNQWVNSKVYLKIENDNSPDCAKIHMKICKKLKIEKYIIWGGNYFTGFLLPSRCWLVWHKETTAKFADVEFAWTNFNELPRLYKWTWNGLQREGNRADELKSRIHPTQKPVGLFVNILKDFEGDPILDCFLGSGSTLIASEKLSRICYGMEIEPKYCDVIITRYCNYVDILEDEIRETVEKNDIQ